MTEIVVEQRIAASPATVYEYLTDSDKWTAWLGGAADLDATVGGIFSMLMPDGMHARGQYVELVPDERVVFTWGWVDRPGIPPGSTTVEIDLIPADGRTVLVLTHRSLPHDEAPLHHAGWATFLPRLARLAIGEDPGPITPPQPPEGH